MFLSNLRRKFNQLCPTKYPPRLRFNLLPLRIVLSVRLGVDRIPATPRFRAILDLETNCIASTAGSFGSSDAKPERVARKRIRRICVYAIALGRTRQLTTR